MGELLTAWVLANRRPLTWFAAAALALAAVAWLVPIRGPLGPESATDRSIGDTPQNPPPEDLAAFLDVKRWGVSLREVNARLADEEAARRGSSWGLNPALKTLGYVGLVVEADANTVLLATTDGSVARVEPGHVLADGRILAAVEGHAITLRSPDDGTVEVLELFPRPSARDAADSEGG